MYIVLVPHLNGIEEECESSLRRLEASGIHVKRRRGCSAIDVARNEMISDAFHDGFESMLFIDADISFNPDDVVRLFKRPEPVVAGVYSKKSVREFTSRFVDGTQEVLFGPHAPHLYPLKYAGAGFLRIKDSVLDKMVNQLKLPLCNTQWGRGSWPFFMPLIVTEGDKPHYLSEDWAFSYRCHQIGVTPMADTSFRLYHWGQYGFTWEDAGQSMPKYESYNYRLT